MGRKTLTPTTLTTMPLYWWSSLCSIVMCYSLSKNSFFRPFFHPSLFFWEIPVGKLPSTHFYCAKWDEKWLPTDHEYAYGEKMSPQQCTHLHQNNQKRTFLANCAYGDSQKSAYGDPNAQVNLVRIWSTRYILCAMFAHCHSNRTALLCNWVRHNPHLGRIPHQINWQCAQRD